MFPPRTAGCAGSAARSACGRATRSSSCPSSRSRRSSAPGRGAGTGPARRRAPARPGRRPRARPTSASSAARRRGSVVGKPGVIDGRGRHERGLRPGRRRVHVGAAGAGVTGRPLERRDRRAQRARRAGRRRPSRGRPRRRGSGPGRSRCGPAPAPSTGTAGQRPGADRRRGSARRGRRAAGHRQHAAAGCEARKRVTPSSPARTPTIQKRSVIFSSSQPPSSKWWWSGAIRKTRLPAGQLEVADLEDDRERSRRRR